MGFGNVASALIMVIAAMSITTGVVVSFKNYYDSTTSSVALVQAEATKEIKTNIHIDVVRFDNTTNTTYAYVKNSGNQRLDPANVDVYIDRIYFPRSATNRTVTLLSDTSIVDDDVWDPKEVIYVKVYNYSLSTTQVHELKVTSQFSGQDTYEFSI